jgi:hypothetical protein
MTRTALWVAFVILVLTLIGAYAQSCDDETIDEVSSDGTIIQLQDGTTWKSLDPSTSASWTSADDVLICGSEMINKDEGGERVDVERLD